MKFKDSADASDQMKSVATFNTSIADSLKAPSMGFEIRCLDAAGNEKWKEEIHNTVVTVGKNDLIDQYFKGSAYTAAWYMGLKSSGSIAVSDTLASHAGWTELTPYSGTRPAITWGVTSSGSNTASTVVISVNATASVAGAFTCTVASSTTGVLYNASDFAVTRGVASGDILNITPTVAVA